MYNSLLNQTRIHQWWRPKAGVLIALLLLATAVGRPHYNHFTIIALLSIITLVGIGTFGHLVNDWGDIEVDQKAGKRNAMANKPLILKLGLLTAVLFVAIAPWYYLPKSNFTAPLLIVEFVLLTLYAMPPFRLKNQPYLAIIIDALYAYVVPASLALYTYTLSFNISFKLLLYLALGVWLLALGIRHIIYHHVKDKKNDALSGTPNLTQKHSIYALLKFLNRWILPLEFISAMVFCYFLGQYHLTIAVITGFVYFVSFQPQQLFHKVWFPKHYLGYYSSDYFFSSYWLIALAMYLSVYNTYHLITLLSVLFFFSNVWQSLIFELNKAAFDRVRSLISKIVNYGIYYFRKYVLRWSEARNRGQYYAQWAKDEQRKQNGTIAICNQNLDKYTETFVNGHVHRLPFHVSFYYGQPYLLQHAKVGHLISNNSTIRALKQGWNGYSNQYYMSKLATHMNSQGVKLILSEFGTTGVKVQEVADVLGLPHICIFYGYDAWHQNVINKTDYSLLFENATKILGVSKDTCEQLAKLGCPTDKIEYLPCYVDFERFQYTPHKDNSPIFLSIGRFAETKSPHLTILAFNEVLKAIPEAKMVMIGKDGGGELFEACHILVKALGIDNKVVFKGICAPNEVYLEMKKARVMVQHSLTTPLNGDKEGTPVAIMEAMAAGLPVIATKHAGIAEMIEHNVTGVLVEEYNYHNMAHEMIRVCKDDALVQKLGENASEFIKTNKLIVNHIEILADLILKNKVE